MDLVRPRDLRRLLDNSTEPSVSVYLPTHRAGPEVRQDPIRLKNLLGEARAKLEMLDVRDADAILEPATALLDDEEFWRRQGDGLAIFLSEDVQELYRLPTELPELVVASDRFHLKPLITFLSADSRFLILAISQKELRLLQGTRQTVQEVELPDVPASLKEVAVHREMASLQFHADGGGSRQQAIFHGHGPETDEELIRKYLRGIDEGLRDAVPDERTPLVLAGVRYLTDLYRHVSGWPEILAGEVQGNPDELSDKELHAAAWTIASARAREEMQAAAERYPLLASRDLAVSGVRDVVPAAMTGRVEVLWVAVGVQRWGAYDEATTTVQVRERPQRGDHDLLDLAAGQTMLQGGMVYAGSTGDVPDDAPIAALLRY